MCHRKVEKAGKDHQTGKGKKEMKRQCHHAGEIMQIQHTALRLFVWTEGKKLTETLTMNNHPTD